MRRYQNRFTFNKILNTILHYLVYIFLTLTTKSNQLQESVQILNPFFTTYQKIS